MIKYRQDVMLVRVGYAVLMNNVRIMEHIDLK